MKTDNPPLPPFRKGGSGDLKVVFNVFLLTFSLQITIVQTKQRPSVNIFQPFNRWAVDIRNQCQRMKVPFFFKQWGGPNRKKTGRKLEGRTWDEIPSAANNMTRAVGNY